MDPNTRAKLPHPNNPYVGTNLVNTSRSRQLIYSKLRRIKVDEVKFESKSLSEVLKDLYNESQKRDPDKSGLNFLLAPNVDLPTPVPTLDAQGNPVPTPAAAEGAPILGDVIINIPTPLKGLTIAEMLDAIVRVADRPIKYSVEDYAIIFSFRNRDGDQLQTRTFRVDPNTFRQGLESVSASTFASEGGGGSSGGGGGGRSGGGGGSRGGQGGQGGQQQQQLGSTFANIAIAPFVGGVGGGLGGFGGAVGGVAAGGISSNPQTYTGELGNPGSGVTFVTRPSYTQVIGVTARNFFAAAGVLLDPPKQLFYNDRTGILMVRATLADLDIIEQAIQVLNTPPSQISIKARFAEVNLSQNKQLGFDWFLGNWLNSGGAMGVQGGSAPSFQGDPGINAPANPSGWFPGPDPSGFNRIAPSPSDNLLTSGLRGSAPALATYTGILTDPQFRVVVKALEQRGGINVLNAPEVTTVSSRQTQIKAVEVKFVVTDLDLNQTSSGGGGGVVGATGGAGAVGSSIQPIATPVELGPVLDVLPYVAADGYTIQMTIIPTLKEFTGYDLETAQLFQAQAQSVGGVPTATIRQNIPLPNFRLRQVATTAIVWDGQTVVLGGLISESETKTKDKVPFLGDLPLFGRLFRSESNIADKKNLMIFVTPSIIDPAGNRVHADEDMPFARTAIPTQTPFSPVPAPTGASTPAPSSK
jgi:type II secretory pathway component GspD/PulD (secretin)